MWSIFAPALIQGRWFAEVGTNARGRGGVDCHSPATGRQMRRITARCEQSGARFRTIPGMADLINGTVTIEQLRDVNIEDLLGREPIHLDLDPVRQQLTDKVVLVTGAAGSIGSELCAQLVHYKQIGRASCRERGYI